jgi:hypothetical protein
MICPKKNEIFFLLYFFNRVKDTTNSRKTTMYNLRNKNLDSVQMNNYISIKIDCCNNCNNDDMKIKFFIDIYETVINNLNIVKPRSNFKKVLLSKLCESFIVCNVPFAKAYYKIISGKDMPINVYDYTLTYKQMWKKNGLGQALMEYIYHPRNMDKWEKWGVQID